MRAVLNGFRRGRARARAGGFGWALAVALLAGGPASANQFMAMSLEDLMDIEVTSVSKKPQRLSSSAAAVFVITGEDIRRMGVTSLPEALRYVPGLQVARIDANKWAVSARGFNGRFSNKLLVLLDGRSIYTPLFAGVYWEVQDTPLEDIERIEVIRGPGGTLWGANAVNGVINIITRNAADTHGGFVSAGFGNEERGFGTVRYGGRTGGGIDWRVYGKFFSRDTSFNVSGAHDDWEFGQGGFRTDWSRAADTFTFQGDYSRGSAGQQLSAAVPPGSPLNSPAAFSVFTEDVRLSGANLLFRWRRDLDGGAEMTLQGYVDHVERDGAALFEERTIGDLDFQHRLAPAGRHNVLWGLGYRYTTDDTRDADLFSLDPSHREVSLFSAFVQDEMRFLDDRLALIVGSKFEHNAFTGFEYQPNIRVSYEPDGRQTFWAAVSRAVRTPARGESDVRLRVIPQPPALPTSRVTLMGSREFRSEALTAYELGYRTGGARWSLDVAAFYNEYRHLRTFDPDTAVAPPDVSFVFCNRLEGDTTGIELAAQWQVGEDWRLQGAYTWLDMDLRYSAPSTSITINQQDASPAHQASLWSTWNPSERIELDAGLRYVGTLDVQGVRIDDYVSLDARAGWKPAGNVEISVVGRDLLDSAHAEFLPTFIASQPTEVERSVHLRVKWSF